jgi:EpsI family protein
MVLLRAKPARTLTVLLLLQIGAFYAIASRSEIVPEIKPLRLFPSGIGAWRMEQDLPIEADVQQVLRADDTVNRLYVEPATGRGVYFFIGYFKTQRYGQAPHSPKNCLPGSGWEPVETGTVPIQVPGRAEPLVANRYVVERGGEKSIVIYWYQSHSRAVASEYEAKFWLVMDAVRYRRSDTSLVKLVIPVGAEGTEIATRSGIQFIQSAFPVLEQWLPA